MPTWSLWFLMLAAMAGVVSLLLSPLPAALGLTRLLLGVFACLSLISLAAETAEAGSYSHSAL
jgi:hypothetical protein